MSFSTRRNIVCILATVSAAAVASAQTSATWNVNANGVWATGSNWTPTVAPGAGGTATFGGVITAPRIVSINSPVTVGTIIFDNLNSYTLAGSSSLTLTGPRTVDVRAGTHAIERPVLGSGGLNKVGPGTLELRAANSVAGNLAVQGGTVRLASSFSLASPVSSGVAVASGMLDLGAGLDFSTRSLGLFPGATLRASAGVSRFAGTTFLAGAPVTLDVVQDATLELAGDWIAASGTELTKTGPGELRVKRIGAGPGSSQLVESVEVEGGRLALIDRASGGASGSVAALVIQPGGSIDLRDSALVLDHDATSPIASVKAWLASGSLGTTTSGLTLGYIASADRFESFPATFDGVDVDEDALIIAAVKPGDSNLDGAVDFDDLLALAQNYDQPGEWSMGDFDYDGVVTFSDLLALAQNYGEAAVESLHQDAGTARLWMDWQGARSIVPEPVSTGFMAVLGVWIALPRRSQKRRGMMSENSLA
jgi:autotransporter-associated beta strand protein